jgi:hypothetical protein
MMAIGASAAAGDELDAALQAARSEFRTLTPDDVAAAAARLRSAKAGVERFLARDPKRAADWRTYLQFPVLERELARGLEADLTDLDRDVLARARANRDGLELAPFVAYRAALDDYLQVQRAYREPATREEFDARLDALTRLLANGQQVTAAAQAEIAQHVGWLRAKRQAPALLAAIRSRFASPNAVVSISAEVISVWSVESIVRDRPVSRAEGDQYTFGVSHLEGHAAAYPVPGESGAGKLEMRFSGVLQTRTTTVQDKVRVQSHGGGPITARKPITLTAEGMVGHPTCSHAKYNNCVDCISTKIKGPVGDAVVTKLAGGYIERNEAEIEADAARDAEREFNREFDEEFAPEIRDANRGLADFRLPLLRQDLHPRRFDFGTTSVHLEAVLLADRLGGPAAAGDPPQLTPGWALGVRLHESFINNLGHGALAGRLYSIEELETLVEDALAKLGLENEADERGDDEIPPGDVGIEFDDAAPVQVQFSRNVATITLRGKRYVYQDDAYPPMNIIIRYRLENDGSALRAALVGPPEYTPPPGVGGLRVIALRRILRSHLNPRIDEEIIQRELHLPDSDEEDEIGPLDFQHVVAEEGWLTIGLRRRNTGSRLPLP